VNVQVSDTTEDDSSRTADLTILGVNSWSSV